MISVILIALLAAFPFCQGAALLQTKYSNRPISVGVAQPGDWRMVRGESIARPLPDFVHELTVQTFLHPTYKVNFLTFMEQGPPQGGFISGVRGIGTNIVTYVLTSARGGGFHFKSEMWGHDTAEGISSFMSSIEHQNCTMKVYNGTNVIQTSNCSN